MFAGTLCVLVISADSSRASFAGRVGEILVYTETAPNEPNDVTISLAAGTYTITDPGASIDAFPGCTYPNPTDDHIVTCLDVGVQQVNVTVGGNDDGVTLDVPVPSIIFGGVGQDELNGGSGPDSIHGEAGSDDVRGGSGDDYLSPEDAFAVLPAENRAEGGDGYDTLIGGDAADVLDGGGGNDQLLGMAGDDTLHGGEGDDLLHGREGTDRLFGQGGNDELGLRQIVGSAAVSAKPPEPGDDQMDGGPGDDLLRPGDGPGGGVSDGDTLLGGEGRDTVTYERRSDPVVITVDGGSADGFPGEGDNVMPDIEKVEGGAGGDSITGSPGNDTIDGGNGDDVIAGLGGNDGLEGGTGGGSDRIRGGAGDDLLSGSGGDDFLAAEDGNDTAGGGEGSDLAEGGEGTDRLSGEAGSDTVTGGRGNDDLNGGDGDDTLDGAEGRDILKGDHGNDSLTGGLGSDDYAGGDGKDVANYELTAGSVEVSLDNVANDGAPGEKDNVRTDAEDVEGGASQDTLEGSDNANALDGASGEDYLDGERGRDDLRAGGARDVVRSRDGNADTVNCGRSADFAIVDRRDRVRGNCERKDTGVRNRPKSGREVVVQPASGSNQFGLRQMQRNVPLEDRINLPLESRIDATAGKIDVVAAGAGAAGDQDLNFSEGASEISRREGGLTELRLIGDLSGCGANAAGRRVHRSRRGKKRKGRGKTTTNVLQGRRAHRSSGVSASAREARSAIPITGRASRSTPSSDGQTTDWIVEDRCAGTLTRVLEGTVTVVDFAQGREIVLRAGESYLARNPVR